MYGDGTQTRSFQYVTDLVDGIYRLLLSNAHCPINIGNTEEVNLIELANEVITLINSKSKIVFKGLPIDDPKLRKLNIDNSNSIEEILEEINNDSPINIREKWLDIGGLFISESDWKYIRENIINGNIHSITKLNDEFEKINRSYNSSAWKWFSYLLKENFSPDEEISKETLKKVIEEWSLSKQKLLNMTLRDAEKEFDSFSKIGYGIDGDDENIDLDFENVRGSYQENKFIIKLKEEIEETILEKDRIIQLLN